MDFVVLRSVGCKHKLWHLIVYSELYLSPSVANPRSLNPSTGEYQISAGKPREEGLKDSTNWSQLPLSMAQLSSLVTTHPFSDALSICSLAEGLCEWQDQILDQNWSGFYADLAMKGYHDPQFSGKSQIGKPGKPSIRLPRKTWLNVCAYSPPTPPTWAKRLLMRSIFLLKRALSPRSEEHTSELQSQSNLVC